MPRQRIARGDYASRLARQGPDEIVTLADSFNQMAESLQEQRRIRDQFIADAAHELRTPLTNLQGYLEAMRDGVIAAEPAAFESLLEETGRLVRLSRSLDTLAEGDAGRVMRSVEVDLGALLVRRWSWPSRRCGRAACGWSCGCRSGWWSWAIRMPCSR